MLNMQHIAGTQQMFVEWLIDKTNERQKGVQNFPEADAYEKVDWESYK